MKHRVELSPAAGHLCIAQSAKAAGLHTPCIHTWTKKGGGRWGDRWGGYGDGHRQLGTARSPHPPGIGSHCLVPRFPDKAFEDLALGGFYLGNNNRPQRWLFVLCIVEQDCLMELLCIVQRFWKGICGLQKGIWILLPGLPGCPIIVLIQYEAVPL